MAHYRQRTAQIKLNEAKHYKSLLEGNILNTYRHLENIFAHWNNQKDTNIRQMQDIESQGSYTNRNIRNYEYKLKDLAKSIESESRDYEINLSKHQQEVNKFSKTGEKLQGLIATFRKDSPELSKAIEDYQNLPTKFLNEFEIVKKKRASLEGLSEEESGEEINKFNIGVKDLKKRREELESTIKSGYQNLATKYGQMNVRKNDLTRQLSEYKRQQDILLDRSSKYQTRRSNLENSILDYKSEETRYKSELETAKHLQEQYKSYQQNYQTSEKHLEEIRRNAEIHSNYTRDIEAKMRHALAESEKYAGWARGHAKKAKQVANLNILGGIGLGILTGGGSLIGMGLNSAVLGGIGHLQNKIFGVGKALPKLSGGNFDIDASRLYNANNFQGSFFARSLGKNAPISSGMLGNIPKLNIPELGGLQSPQHFNMPQLPDLHQLPNLETALGRLTNPSELSKLTLGLPKITSKNGKKYNFAVLYDPNYMKKLKKVMKKASKPYINYNNNLNQGLATI